MTTMQRGRPPDWRAPAAVTAGTAFNFTVTALDSANSTATGYTGTVHFTTSDGQAVLPADATLTNGQLSTSRRKRVHPQRLIGMGHGKSSSIGRKREVPAVALPRP